jgi:hypothetical protein
LSQNRNDALALLGIYTGSVDTLAVQFKTQSPGVVRAHVQQGSFIRRQSRAGGRQWLNLRFRLVLFNFLRFFCLSALVPLPAAFEQAEKITKKHGHNCHCDGNIRIL